VVSCLPLIVLASCTKRAQIPFSAWLPAAIAAPTPVSSLVHSSTLVTAGIYLALRFQPILSRRVASGGLLVLGSLTALMAGLAALVEMDLKKIVALSTLSQLGLMATTLGAGLPSLAFFHLLSHAYFKALLFITVGAIIHSSHDYQDLRKIGLNHHSNPATLGFMVAANLSLCGIPFTSGFFSKDLCIEEFSESLSNGAAVSVLYAATLLTAAYTARFILLASTSLFRQSPVNLALDKDPAILSAMGGLFPIALVGGALLNWAIIATPQESFITALEKASTSAVILGGFYTGLVLRKSQMREISSTTPILFS